MYRGFDEAIFLTSERTKTVQVIAAKARMVSSLVICGRRSIQNIPPVASHEIAPKNSIPVNSWSLANTNQANHPWCPRRNANQSYARGETTMVCCGSK